MLEPRRFGPLDVRVPVIGQGTWHFEHANRREAVAALRRGVDLGLTHIDTAELYGGGIAEEIVGEALADRRDELFIVSKVLPENASRRGAVLACEQTLRRLRTDHLDCYLLHWPGRHPLAATIAAFEELQGAGKIRSYGVSNFDEDALREAVGIAGAGRIACDQVLYHLEERHVEGALAGVCDELRVALVGYSPFGSGSFPSPSSRGGKVLAEVARAHEATPRQVALAFLARAAFVIPKAATVAHAEENAGALKLRLSGDDHKRIDSAFPLRVRSELPVI
jgi:diketogulonate reductase-like aldo/keto reductase